MDMTAYWDSVAPADHLTHHQVWINYPAAYRAGKVELLSDDDAPAVFAETVIPNLGPGGPTSEADEADLEARDPDREMTDPDGPSLSGDKALVAYKEAVDELWVYRPAEKQWVLWNY